MKKIFLLIILIYLSNVFAQTQYRFFINNINMPIDNQGVLADTYGIPGEPGGKYDGVEFLYSGGFFLSGKEGDSIWTNGIATSIRINDYLPGKVGSNPLDPLNKIYAIYSVDPPFGTSWQNWKDAVSLGALFYDGDNDGIYNPVDLNGNGIWDLNEDRPDLLGDLTTWCVFNDGVDASQRLYNNVTPKGIEIHQTMFAEGLNVIGPIKEIIFIRYRIVNVGTVSSEYDSVYFSSCADPDLGFGFDDLAGSDTINNSGYVYNNGTDSDFGINPPAFFIQVLQGPISYIPGETFMDINSNGLYDNGIDSPLDSALNNKGIFLGSEVLPGAKNLEMTSFIPFLSSDADIGTPKTAVIARNYMQGKSNIGLNYDPCTFWYGAVLGEIDCSTINPIYMYSGDPVTQYGWINTLASDQRLMINTGPFKLKMNKPMDIWFAYIVGRGTDNLNSITKSREICTFANNFYRTNFTNIAVDVNDENSPSIESEFNLIQNYPNPFNPSTVINFNLPVEADVTLKVFNILGEEVSTLIQNRLNAGAQQVNFNAAGLNSGVYLYQLEAKGVNSENFTSIKKMVLIK